MAPRSRGPTVTVTGVRAIDKRLKQMGKEAPKMLRTAAKLAIYPIHRQTKALAPKGSTGNLRKSIKVAVIKKNKRGFIGQRVTAARPQGSHAHLIEYGHIIGSVRKGTKPIQLDNGDWINVPTNETWFGATDPNPFMERAFKSKRRMAERIYFRSIEEGITKLSSDAAKTIKSEVREVG